MRPRDFWIQQPATLNSVLLRCDAEELDIQERGEILSLLPSVHNKAVLDLAAGIGRFTGEFAKTAAHVTSSDLVPQFMEENRRRNKAFQNITYRTSCATELAFEPASFDLIFVNWLFMYLEEEQAQELAARLAAWLKPGGTLFFRESCAAVSHTLRDSYPVHYRSLSFYHRLMEPHLLLLDTGSIQVFIDRYANPFQCYWLHRKHS